MSTLNEDNLQRSNEESLAKWAIDVAQDPYDMPIEELNPVHLDLFAARKVVRYFTRLREEDPVHYHEGGQFGPYWSITKYEDI